MSSPTGKQPGQQPSGKVPLEVLEQAAASLHYENQQLKRTLWLAAMRNGGSMILNEQEVDLLWRLGFERTPERLLKVVAFRMQEANPADIEQMAAALINTTKTITDYAEAHERLKEYPLQYIEFMLSTHIRHDGEQWISRAAFEAKQATAPPS